jgi:FlgD Ig-like domain
MKLLAWLTLPVVLILYVQEAPSQNTDVPWSVFDMGFEELPTPNGTVTSSVGQVFVDDSRQLNTGVESGFLANVLFRKFPITSGYGSALVATRLDVTISPHQGRQPVNGFLFFRKGGGQAYDSTALTQVGDSLRTTIPADAITIRGVEYFVRLQFGEELVTYPDGRPALIRVRVDTHPSPLTLQRRVYRMISVPVELANPGIVSVLGDDYGEYDASRWRLFRWQDGDYAEYLSSTRSFTPGSAFWLITEAGDNFDVDNGLSVASLDNYQLTVQSGWNQIGNPFAFPVSWDAVANSNQVTGPYYFDGVEYIPGAAILNPWEGYFVRSNSSVPIVLSIPPVESVGSPGGIVSLPKLDSEADYALQLAATVPGTDLKDTYNVVGFLQHPGASDYPEPPPIGEYIQLSIVDGGERYMTRLKPVPTDGHHWELELRSTLSDLQIQVALGETGQLPEGFKVYVLDEDNFNAIPIVDKAFGLHMGSAGTIRLLKIIIGTQEYAETHNDGISLVPLTYALEQNYPNPFNPNTTIRYQLSKRSVAVMEVFNILGQRVKTLVDAEQVTGTYAVVWDGRNDAGYRVASGAYVYRLRAGTFVATRKLVLLR